MKFAEKVYQLCKKIPGGKVTTYSEIARALDTKGYRAIGQALRSNKDPIGIPCFKVVMSDGRIGGYCGSDPEKIAKKIEKLKRDGVEIIDGKIELEKYLHRL